MTHHLNSTQLNSTLLLSRVQLDFLLPSSGLLVYFPTVMPQQVCWMGDVAARALRPLKDKGCVGRGMIWGQIRVLMSVLVSGSSHIHPFSRTGGTGRLISAKYTRRGTPDTSSLTTGSSHSLIWTKGKDTVQ